MEGELHNESNFCDAQLLTTHTLSAKGPTLNCDLSICFGRASFVDRSKNRRKNNVIMKVFVWLLQRVTQMVRNFVFIDLSWPTLRRSWLGIFRRVSVVSYNIFAMAVVACTREEQREAIVGDQRDMDIGKAADAAVESEYVGGKLKTKTPSVSSLKSRERTLRTKCKTSERLCAKSKDLKLMSCIDGSSYSEGTGNSENELKSVRSRYCIFECIGGYEEVTGRRKLRCREPSRISSRVKIGLHKNRKTRCLFKRKILGAVPRSSILYKFTKSSIRKEHVCFKYFFGISTKKEKKRKKKNAQCMLNKRRKRVVLKNRCEVFRDKNHQSLYQDIKVYNDIESNPGPVYVNELCTVAGSFHQGNEELFGINSGKQCVVNSLVAIIFNAIASCFTETWNSTKMDNILRVGNSLYSYIRLSIKEDLLLLSEIPSALCLDEETYRLSYSESITGDVNMLESRDCYFSLLEALRSLRRRYNACLLTIFCNTVAIFFAEYKIKLFDAHSRDKWGNACSEGTSVLLEFSRLEKLIDYLQRFYPCSKLVPFEVTGVCVTKLMIKEYGVNIVNSEKMEGNFSESTKVHSRMSIKEKDSAGDSKTARLDKMREQRRRERKMETCEQRVLRLQKMRERNKAKRRDESEGEKRMRLDKAKERNRKARNIETEESRKLRLEKLKKCREQRKNGETIEQREMKLRKLKEGFQQRKSEETVEQREVRLKKLKESFQQRKNQETVEQREVRLKKLKEEFQQRKHQETVEQREVRLKKLKEDVQQRRNQQTVKQREARLKKLKEGFQKRKNQETVEQREVRLKKLKEKFQQRKYQETVEQREVRLKKLKEEFQQRKNEETVKQRAVRLNKLKESFHQRKNQETVEQRETRLKKRRDSFRQRKQLETVEQRKVRLKKWKEGFEQRKNQETVAKRETRLKKRRDSLKQRKQQESVEEREGTLKTKKDSFQLRKTQETVEQGTSRLLKGRRSMEVKRSSEKKGDKRELRLENIRKRGERKRKSETEVDKDAKLKSKKKRRSETKDGSIRELISKFHQVIAEGPTFVCICCDQLWYKHSVHKAGVLSNFENNAISKCIKGTSSNELDSQWICRTCLANLKKNKIPRCAIANKMAFPYKPENLDLTELEWRLVSPRLVFEKLHEAPRGKQMKICGNIVNVPANVVNTVSVLPRLGEQEGTIKVQLKRKLKYKSYILSQNIRPEKVFEVAQWLIESGSLFKQEKIALNKEWVNIEKRHRQKDVRELEHEMCSTSYRKDSDMLVSPSEAVPRTNLYFCLECQQCSSTFYDLNDHMVMVHKADYDTEDCTDSYRCSVIKQHPDQEVEHLYFCSICNHCENQEESIRYHMTVIHDIVSEQFVREHCLPVESNSEKIWIHRIVEPSNVLLVEVHKNGYMVRNSVPILISIAVPASIHIGVCGDKSLLPINNENSRVSESYAAENDTWNENDDTEECAGALDTMLISPEFIEDDERTQSVFSFAPGEGNKPLSIFKDKNCEELAYPGIFCGEARAENSARDVPVYYSDICKSELRRSDRRASMCIENLFFKVKKLQMKILLGKSQVALRKHKTKGRKITAGDLKKDGALEKLCYSDDGYRFLRALRGSPPYFEKAKKDLFAMIRQLGPATFFCSFSAAETKWKHLLRILGKLIDKKEYSDEELDNLTWEEKTRLIQSDPVTCARHFDYQFQQFFIKFLSSNLSPLGKIEDWFYRVEFQQRGSPHIHMLLWIKGAPRFGVQSDEEVVDFINQVITCSKAANDVTLSELVIRQYHSHSQTCKKKNRMVCRFNFPQPPMRNTLILYPLEDDIPASEKQKHKGEFGKLHEKLNDMKDGEDISFDDLLEKLGVSEENYILAIRASLVTATIFLKRNPNELRINNYNKSCLLAWRANMDIQYVLDVYACAMYIVSYISKAQRGMSELLRVACEEAKSGNSSVKQQVRDIGNKFLNAVEISAQEAVYLALQLPMRRSSREVVFIPSSPPDERIQLLKSLDEIKEMEDESEEIETGSLIKRYIKRPNNLENVTLADWTAWYDMKSNGKNIHQKSCKEDNDGLLLETQDEDNLEDDYESHSNESTESKTPRKVVKKRAKCRVIRSVWFNKEVDAEKYFRELLFLFSPWRDEGRDIERFRPFEQRCREISEQINCQLAEYCPYSSQIDEAMLNMTNDIDENNMWDLMAPNTQHTELIDSSDNIRETGNDLDNGDQNYDLSDDLGIPSCSVVDQDAICNEMSDDEYRQAVRSLNNEQLVFFYHILHLLRTSEVAFYCFLSGGGGVGKSHVTKALYQAAVKCLNSNVGDDFRQIRALILAPTGKAAFNIRGCTIHSALSVPANRSLHNYQRLDSSRLNSLRNKLGGLKVIFVDEISMVGNSMFNVQLNKRLQEIKGVDSDFGGVSIIAIGDLFQLEPVFDGYVFETLKGSYGTLATNLWRKHFAMYELCQIMRQRESRLFAEILNRLREGKHTEEDIRILKQRLICENDPNYPHHVPHLFYQNKKVENFNKKVYNASHDEKFSIIASDFVIGAQSEQMKETLLSRIPNDPRKTMQLASELCIAINQRTEIAVNTRLDDGLTNGAGNVVKYVELYNPPQPQGIIWVKFDHDHVGEKTRSENRQLYTSNIDRSWTPIMPTTAQFCIGKSTSCKIVRKQFPLRLSAAKTIHRAQGDTERQVVVNLEASRKIPHIHYVALSRVTTLEGLYITNLNEEKICVSSKVEEEMNRLRTNAYLKPCLRLISQQDESFVKIMFLNARSLHKHFLDVKNYLGFYSPDVAIFSETRLSVLDTIEEFEIEKYTLFRNDEAMILSNQRPFHGTAIYCCLSCKLGYPKCQNVFGVEITVTELECLPHVIIASIYRSPSVPVRQLYEALRHLYCRTLSSKQFHIIIGDFNVNWLNKQQMSGLHNLMVSEYGYCQVVNDYTTCNRTIIDHIYTNIGRNYIDVGILETYYSDHKAVWIGVNKELRQ